MNPVVKITSTCNVLLDPTQLISLYSPPVAVIEDLNPTGHSQSCYMKRLKHLTHFSLTHDNHKPFQVFRLATALQSKLTDTFFFKPTFK